MIIVQRKRQSVGGYAVPAGGDVLWYGLATALPSPWVIDTALSSLFVMGADTGEGSKEIPAGSFIHDHNNPAATSINPNHTHPITGAVGATGSGSTTFYGSGSNGTAPGGHGHGNGVGNSSSNGAHSHVLTKTDPATIYPPYRRLYWIKSTEEAALPVGGIVMWDKVIADLQEGFHICAGGTFDAIVTPDLRDEFIWTAGVDDDVNNTGGAETHVHGNTNSQNAGEHSHSMSVTTGAAGSNSNASGYAGVNVSAGGHRHGVSATTDNDPDHAHTVGNTSPASSLPPYLALYYVMRTI